MSSTSSNTAGRGDVVRAGQDLGALERRVMDVLWDCPDSMCARDVREILADGLAYTTIATVLTHLVDKGMVERVSRGRTWAYRPLWTQQEWAAGRMLAALVEAPDRIGVLGRFVAELDPADVTALRSNF